MFAQINKSDFVTLLWEKSRNLQTKTFVFIENLHVVELAANIFVINTVLTLKIINK